MLKTNELKLTNGMIKLTNGFQGKRLQVIKPGYRYYILC